MKVKEESEKDGLKLNIQKTKIIVSYPITSWPIDGETVETVVDFIFLGSKITEDGDSSHEIKRHLHIGRTDVEAETPILGHPMQRTDSLKKTLMLGTIEGGRRRG